MKNIFNFLSNPVLSFILVSLGVLFILKFPRIFSSKKFFYTSTFFSILFFSWAMFDLNFRGLILKPDNIPIVFLLGAVYFFTWFSFRKATLNDERIAQGLQPLEGTEEMRQKVWCWPNLVYIELLALIGMSILLIIWSLLVKAPLEEPADLSWAPNPAKAPWYFLGLQEMLVYFDPWMAGVIIPLTITIGLILIPYVDKNPKGVGYYTLKERPLAIGLYMFGWIVLWIFLILVGTFFRGPNWTFYGPFEIWDEHKLISIPFINLSNLIYEKILSTSLPVSIIIREIFGIILLLGYFIILPIFSVKIKSIQTVYKSVGKIRYYLLALCLLVLFSLPTKMILNWTLGLKYIVYLPEWGINF